MFTVSIQGKHIIFMDFYPCKAKELTTKLVAVNDKVIQTAVKSKNYVKKV